jgi:hypothetical protein
VTKTQYRKALEQLGLPIAGERTAKVLGISTRQSQRYAAGEAISETVALLLQAYLRLGKLPEE